MHSRLPVTSNKIVTSFHSKVVVGSVAVTEDHERVLLCKLSIFPVGLWAILAGCMESKESVGEGAAREAQEPRAKVKIGSLLCSITSISQSAVAFC